jgi:hypothetical protein
MHVKGEGFVALSCRGRRSGREGRIARNELRREESGDPRRVKSREAMDKFGGEPGAGLRSCAGDRRRAQTGRSAAGARRTECSRGSSDAVTKRKGKAVGRVPRLLRLPCPKLCASPNQFPVRLGPGSLFMHSSNCSSMLC